MGGDLSKGRKEGSKKEGRKEGKKQERKKGRNQLQADVQRRFGRVFGGGGGPAYAIDDSVLRDLSLPPTFFRGSAKPLMIDPRISSNSPMPLCLSVSYTNV